MQLSRTGPFGQSFEKLRTVARWSWSFVHSVHLKMKTSLSRVFVLVSDRLSVADLEGRVFRMEDNQMRICTTGGRGLSFFSSTTKA